MTYLKIILLLAQTVSAMDCLEMYGAERNDGTTVRVASISYVPTKFDLRGNVVRLEAAFREAAEGGAKIAVAPEGALDGYVVNEIIAGEVREDSMSAVAIPIDGPVIRKFQSLARELEMCLVFGFAERIGGSSRAACPPTFRRSDG